ncbi:MAG TPA: CehA/McbA family metallohydrolase [Longilinea sp.]|nr:CehA/McbA family metallohydrolase [Longilinea sp.]
MPSTVEIPLFIEHTQEGSYFTLPFTMPADIEKLTLSYRYERYEEKEAAAGAGMFHTRDQVNIVDLGLIAPDGSQVGASGSDKLEITVSETFATPGYHAVPLVPGEWKIIVGAYNIGPQGLKVVYTFTFTEKILRLLKGDLHTHTVASDGVQTVEELAWRARRNGLDFVAITDHNQTISPDSLPYVEGVTLIPGIEWTHFKGHSNFLGVAKPYDGSFMANTPDEVKAHFTSAHERGATIVINHPIDSICPFQFDMDTLPYDLLEVWNGPMRESNLKAVGYWHSLLVAGRRIPICGGSDFHRDTPFLFLGGPTMCVFAQSAGPTDILKAVRQGHSYIIFSPQGPSLVLKAGEAIMGDTVDWTKVKEVQISVGGLYRGDVVRVITAAEATPVLEAPSDGSFTMTYPVSSPGFVRVDVLRGFLPGLPLLPALLSNPIYFTGSV